MVSHDPHNQILFKYLGLSFYEDGVNDICRAADELAIGQFKDYYYPNNEGARSIWYHDHAEHHTSSDVYEGQAGVYVV